MIWLTGRIGRPDLIEAPRALGDHLLVPARRLDDAAAARVRRGATSREITGELTAHPRRCDASVGTYEGG